MIGKEVVGGIVAMAVGAGVIYGGKAMLSGMSDGGFSFVQPRPSSNAVEDILQREADAINKRKGKSAGMFSTNTVLGAEAKGRRLYLTIGVPGKKFTYVAAQGMEVRRKTASNYCANAYLKDALKRGAIIDVAFRDDTGATFYSMQLDHSACA